MVIANTSDGSTAAFDLTNEAQHRSLQELIKSGQVTALSLHHNSNQTTLTLPRRFKRASVSFGAELVTNGVREPVGERIFAQADNVRVGLTLTFRSRLIRCDLARTGRMLYDPSRRE